MRKMIIVLSILLVLQGCYSSDSGSTVSSGKITEKVKTTSKKEDKLNSDGTIDVYVYGDCEKIKTASSSWISYISYYPDSNHLIVCTNEGQKYVHANVSESKWNSFKNADSYGSFYNSNFKSNSSYWVTGYDGTNSSKITVHYE